MGIDRWNEIFMLLSMVIMADDRVYKEEVDTFVDSAMDIKAAVADDTLITRDIIFEWFRGNKDSISESLKAKELNIKALKIIMSLAKFRHRAAILRAMVAVSMADKEYHPSEESLIEIAAAHWGLSLEGELILDDITPHTP